MKQIFQSLTNGETLITEIPVPRLSENQILIKTEFSLVSAGTERMLVDFGKGNLLDKAKQQPDKVKEVINKAKTDGVFSTIEAVNYKLNEPLPLGYCNVGKIIELGKKVKNFKLGDRVVSNGAHAEIVAVSEKLCANIPSEVDSIDAAFTVLGSIGLQGIRLAKPSLGEVFVVSGLGLIGLLTAQLLLAQGCIVFGIDPDKNRCNIANKFGIKTFHLNKESDPVSWCLKENKGIGIDGVLITATTSSNEPLEIAAKICRKRGRIILIGVTGMDLRRDLFYKKELSFQVSCSYGPGRYDPKYENNCEDYPLGFVRWTEQRNFQAVLQTLASGKLIVKDLITHKYKFNKASEAYTTLSEDSKSMGILLEYPSEIDTKKRSIYLKNKTIPNQNLERPIVSFIGAGNYASRVLIPNFYKTNCDLESISANKGDKATFLGHKYKFNKITTDIESVIKSKNSNTIVIATRHDSHGKFVENILKNGKNVFVEKPLCLTSQELNNIKKAYSGKNILMIGYNRRFAPLLKKFKNIVSKLNGPKSIIYTCNSGYIDSDHWSQDPVKGGGRLIGEACHFVDLLRFIINSSIVDIKITFLSEDKIPKDTFTLTVSFFDGSIATVHYYSNGSKSFPKERIEAFADGKVIKLDNFLKLKTWGFTRNISIRNFSQNKGQKNCIDAFINSVKNKGEAPIPVDQIFEIQEWLLKLKES